MSLLADLVDRRPSDSTEKIIAEYIWVDAPGMPVRSKARTLPGPVSDPSKLPKWGYNGFGAGQAPGEDRQVILYPQAIFKDPFRGGNNILVSCDAYTPAGDAIPTNMRHAAANVVAEEPWCGIEQEYPFLQKDVNWPIGGFPGPQGPYYCGVGADKAFSRDIIDSHYKACLYAGVNIIDINGEVMPGQWESQFGPSVGISDADELWVARYILERITEIAEVVPYFVPKPILGDWNGVGAHTNDSTKLMRNYGEVIKKEIKKLQCKHKDDIAAYGEDNEHYLTGRHETADISTKATRNYGGFELRKKEMEKLQRRHKDHIAAYGEDNEHCLTGRHETAAINTSSGVADASGASVQVGRDTEKAGKGCFEDWRPLLVLSGLFVIDKFLNKTEIMGSRWTLKFPRADGISRTFSFEKIVWKRLFIGNNETRM